jgi:hypothetical protein
MRALLQGVQERRQASENRSECSCDRCNFGQGHRKVDEAVNILLTANLGEEGLTMKSRLLVSASIDS